MRKNIKNIILAILVSAVLCGCGNNSDTQTSAPETEPDTITAETKESSDTEEYTEQESEITEETSDISEESVSHETIFSPTAAASKTDELISENSTNPASETTPTETTVQSTSPTVTTTTVTTAAPVQTVPSETTFKTVDKDKYKNAEDVVFSEYFSDSLFIGDSICSGLKIYAGCLNVENVAARLNVSTWGINKYTFQYKSNSTAELDALSIVKLYQPKQIYIWMGMNDLYVVSEDKYAENLCSLAKSYIDSDPGCKVYAVSISPMSSSHKWNVEMDGNNRINEYNKAVEEKCSEVDYLTYINIHDSLTDSYGYLASENNGGDGIHLSASAYKKVLTEIYYYMEYERNTVYEIPEDIVTEATSETAPETEETTSDITTAPVPDMMTLPSETEETTVTTVPPEETASTETSKSSSNIFKHILDEIDKK
ncbi:MAG: GDSL-type esterase/lipase family protein [Oscillospiraceae bacterium]